MDDTKTNPGPEPNEPEILREVTAPREGVQYIYGNHLNLDWTGVDIRIRVAELTVNPKYRTPSGTKTLRIEERASISLAWPLAKYLRDILSDALAAYEEKNGEIKPPESP